MSKLKYLSVLMLFSFQSLFILGQTSKLDSLENYLLQHVEQDTVRVDLLNEIADMLYAKDIDKTLLYAKEAGDLAVNLDYKFGKAESLMNIGTYHYWKANYPEALDFKLKSLKIFEELDSNTDAIGNVKIINQEYIEKNRGASKIILDYIIINFEL